MAQVIGMGAWSGHHQVDAFGRIPDLAKRLDQQIAALLFVKATEKKKEPFSAQIWKCVEENLARAFQVCRRGGAVVHDDFQICAENGSFFFSVAFTKRRAAIC